MKTSAPAAPAIPSPSFVDLSLEVRKAHTHYMNTLSDPVANEAALENLRAKHRAHDLARFRAVSQPSTEIAEIYGQLVEAQRALAVATQVAYESPRVPFVTGQDPKDREMLVRERRAANIDDERRKRNAVHELTERLHSAQNRESERVAEMQRLTRNTRAVAGAPV
jgi:hypothetical protein